MPKMFSIVCVSTVLPRPCGIATFNQDVIDAVKSSDIDTVSVAIQRGALKYAYPTTTIATIHQKVESDYGRVAALINKRKPDVVLVQHEFGIYGGKYGEYVLSLLRELSVPVVVVMHRYEIIQDTVAKQERMKIAHNIARYASAIVVISKITRKKMAADLLKVGIRTPVVHIPHGTPAVADYALDNPKQKVLGRDVPTLTTFGLFSERKGVQDIVEVMPEVVRRFPTIVFRVLGRPHPTDPKAQELMRNIKQRVKQLGLENNVMFVTRFLSVQDIMENLQATDLYITFYADPDQTSSGTLAFALAAGCCVISTPYVHARELLASGRGIFIPFRDRQALQETIIKLLDNKKQREECRRKALRFGRKTAWSLVGQQYVKVMRAAAESRKLSDSYSDEKEILPIVKS